MELTTTVISLITTHVAIACLFVIRIEDMVKNKPLLFSKKNNISFISIIFWEIELIYLSHLLIKFILLKTIKKVEIMDFKILGKAMRFMFFPTIGVLLMLLVGFFDPIAMWEWIKSNSGWAIFVRTALFIIECVLVGVMYNYYIEEEELNNIIKTGEIKGKEEDVYYHTEIRRLFSNGTDGKYVIIKTSNPKVIIIKDKKE